MNERKEHSYTCSCELLNQTRSTFNRRDSVAALSAPAHSDYVVQNECSLTLMTVNNRGRHCDPSGEIMTLYRGSAS